MDPYLQVSVVLEADGHCMVAALGGEFDPLHGTAFDLRKLPSQIMDPGLGPGWLWLLVAKLSHARFPCLFFYAYVLYDVTLFDNKADS